MQLFATPDNPMPPSVIVSVARARDGVDLRVARWTRRSARATVTVTLGRGEYIEQYYEVVRELIARRFDVVIFDWRGQGSSDRVPFAGRLGRRSTFNGYHRDLLAVETQILRPFARRPWYALGHSMGGALLLDQAHNGTSPFERLVLTAPLIDIPLRYRAVKQAFIATLDWAGLGALPVPGGRFRTAMRANNAQNALTGDQERFARLASFAAVYPDLASGPLTVGWLAGAFRMMERFRDPRFAVATLLPTLIIAAGSDRIVDTAATERFALQLKAGRCVTVPRARHQILAETSLVRAQFWAAFDAFVPGTADPSGPSADRPSAEMSRLRRLVTRLRPMPAKAFAEPEPQPTSEAGGETDQVDH